MNLSELIVRSRAESRDTKKPPFWSDDTWRDRLNEAADEAAIRSMLISNDTIELDVTIGEAYVDYPENAWSIRRVFLGDKRLVLVDREMLDAVEGSAWETQAGTPCACYEISGQLRLYPIPIASETARMVAYCTPANPMTKGDDEPEGVKPRLHIKLIDWALSCFYNNPDVDSFDPGRAQKYEAKFEAIFGPRPDEKAMRNKRINVRRHVAGSYF